MIILAAIAGLTVVVAGVASPIGDLPGREFYGTAAQIFPLLVLPLAVGHSAESAWRSAASIPRAILIGSLLLGELFALVALSGTFATANEKAYQYYIADELGGAENADLEQVMDQGPLVGGSQVLSQVFAGFTVAALVAAVVSVFILATARTED